MAVQECIYSGGGGGIGNTFYTVVASGLSASAFTDIVVGFTPKIIFFHVYTGTTHLMFKWDISADTIRYYNSADGTDNDGYSWKGTYIKFENNTLSYKAPTAGWASYIAVGAVG